jgi:hypothetical protein
MQIITDQLVAKPTTETVLINLGEIFGPSHLYHGRAPYDGSQWLPPPFMLEMMSGMQLVVAGDLPVLCHRAVTDHEGLAVLRDLDFGLPQELHTYADQQELRSQLRRLTGHKRVVYQHVHPAEELETGVCWFEPMHLSWLNNKAHLLDLVEARHCPRRQVMATTLLRKQFKSLPFVVKAATDLSTGGCVDVRLCRSRAELDEAQRFFSSCDYVVIEEFLNFRKVLNIEYVIDYSGSINYLGASEQLMTSDLKPAGNWIHRDIIPPAEMRSIIRQVVQKAVDKGYYGVIGVDIGLLARGRALVLDLNFRINASTTPLMLQHRLSEFGSHGALYLCWTYAGSYRELVRAASEALEAGLFLPTCFYNPTLAGYGNRPPMLAGFVLADECEQLDEARLKLAEYGFH